MATVVSADIRNRAGLYGIRPAHAEAVVRAPDKTKDVVPASNLKVHFFSKHITSTNPPHYLVVKAIEDKGNLRIDEALRAYDDLSEDLALMSPTEILYAIVQNFGLDIVVGTRRAKFVLDEVIELAPDQTSANFLQILNPSDRRFHTGIHVRPRNESGRLVIDCALAYALDDDAYIEYLRSHR